MGRLFALTGHGSDDRDDYALLMASLNAPVGPFVCRVVVIESRAVESRFVSCEHRDDKLRGAPARTRKSQTCADFRLAYGCG